MNVETIEDMTDLLRTMLDARRSSLDELRLDVESLERECSAIEAALLALGVNGAAPVANDDPDEQPADMPQHAPACADMPEPAPTGAGLHEHVPAYHLWNLDLVPGDHSRNMRVIEFRACGASRHTWRDEVSPWHRAPANLERLARVLLHDSYGLSAGEASGHVSATPAAFEGEPDIETILRKLMAAHRRVA